MLHALNNALFAYLYALADAGINPVFGIASLAIPPLALLIGFTKYLDYRDNHRSN